MVLVVYGISEDYEFIKALSWASGELALKNDAAASMLSLSWKEEDFQLGIMTFAYQGVCCQLVHRTHSQLIVQVMRLSRIDGGIILWLTMGTKRNRMGIERVDAWTVHSPARDFIGAYHIILAHLSPNLMG